jgi:hypothetical protein
VELLIGRSVLPEEEEGRPGNFGIPFSPKVRIIAGMVELLRYRAHEEGETREKCVDDDI